MRIVTIVILFLVLLSGCGIKSVQHPAPIETEVIRKADWEVEFRDVFFLDAKHGWVIGENLNETTKPGMAGYNANISFINATEGWAIDASRTALLHTLDGGDTWERVEAPIETPLNAVHFTANGEKQRALTQVSATGPTWASNGKQIYFSSEKLGGVKVPTLFAVDVDGENPKKLTDAGQVCEDPDESPDGQWIAYVSIQDGSKDIYLIRADGGGLRKVTNDPGLEFSPAWVPSTFNVSPSASTQMMLWGILKQTANKK